MSRLDQIIAIAGAAETELGALPHLSEMDLRADAARRALADAGLTLASRWPMWTASRAPWTAPSTSPTTSASRPPGTTAPR
ncbi:MULTISPECIES: hypothetical protein [unclassified Cupriavidus]|uniref:hypothetical protein n=1 Tax=unclassified Cupriavidus TaxID=2640874 RepID=UPI002101B0A3|nr:MULTISPECIES: hypothetical protein [unclassified Cupriavidus]